MAFCVNAAEETVSQAACKSNENSRPVALVTGGARRVGAAVVEELIRCGFHVIFTYYASEEAANALVESYWSDDKQSSPAERVIADLAEPDVFIGGIINAVIARGRLDLLVHNASIYKPDPPDAAARAVLMRDANAVHVISLMRLIDGLAPLLRQSRGAVVTMVDLLAERPMLKYSAYCASKAALQNLTLSLARALAPEVRVNGIAPGVVEWPADMPAADREKYLKRVPLGRAGTPQDVARLVRFLALEGTYITGQIIRLDGGRSIA